MSRLNSPRIVWITGASSGIGAALASAVPYEDARLICISRRPSSVGEHLAADLADPAAWEAVGEQFASALNETECDEAVLLHFSGAGGPHGPAADVEPRAYARSALLNGTCGPVLAQSFLVACRRAAVKATIVLCSSPAAAKPRPGFSHYGAGKGAAEYWVQSVAAEQPDGGARILGVIPFAVDTAMVREVMSLPADVQPQLSAHFRQKAADGELASPEQTAAEIWAVVTGDTPSGTLVPVGGAD